VFYDSDNDYFLDDFGVDVTYKITSTASGTIIRGIWDEPGTVLPVGNANIIVENPQVRIKTDDALTVTNKSQIIKNSKTYNVRNHLPDGTGFTLLILAEA
jgi:hypothetical protein